MKKKNFLIMIVIFIIVSFIIVTLVLKKLEYDRKIIGDLIYNSWNKYKDEYNTTKIIKDYVDPIPNDTILFGEKTVEFCVFYEFQEGEKLEDDDTGKYVCTKYDYSVTAKKLIVIVEGEEVVYDYDFDENDQLILTLSGDGYVHNYYYNKNAG